MGPAAAQLAFDIPGKMSHKGGLVTAQPGTFNWSYQPTEDCLFIRNGLKFNSNREKTQMDAVKLSTVTLSAIRRKS